MCIDALCAYLHTAASLSLEAGLGRQGRLGTARSLDDPHHDLYQHVRQAILDDSGH